MEEEPINLDEYEIPEEELKEDNKLKKFIIGTIGIALVILMISLSIFGWGNDDRILGLIDSSKIEDNKIMLKDLTIDFNQGIYNELADHYKANDGKEIKVCLLGESTENYILINNIVYPKIISQSYKHVDAERCPKKTLISVHSQPNRQCLPSDQDLRSYEYLKQFNEDVMVAVMCDEGRLNFYN